MHRTCVLLCCAAPCSAPSSLVSARLQASLTKLLPSSFTHASCSSAHTLRTASSLSGLSTSSCSCPNLFFTPFVEGVRPSLLSSLPMLTERSSNFFFLTFSRSSLSLFVTWLFLFRMTSTRCCYFPCISISFLFAPNAHFIPVSNMSKCFCRIPAPGELEHLATFVTSGYPGSSGSRDSQQSSRRSSIARVRLPSRRPTSVRPAQSARQANAHDLSTHCPKKNHTCHGSSAQWRSATAPQLGSRRPCRRPATGAPPLVSVIHRGLTFHNHKSAYNLVQ